MTFLYLYLGFCAGILLMLWMQYTIKNLINDMDREIKKGTDEIKQILEAYHD